MPADSPPLLKADKATIAFEALKDGKVRASCTSWPDPLVAFPGERIEIVWGHGQINLRKKGRLR